MARVTRSKTGMLKDTKTDESSVQKEPLPKSLEPVTHSPIETVSRPKRRRIKPTTSFPQEKTRRILNRLKPGYNNRPTKKPRVVNDMEFLSKVNNLITSRVSELDPSIKNQIDELQKFKIFKDMKKVDMKIVKILQSDIGELKQRDIELSNIIEQDDTNSKTFDKKFRELYNITDDVQIT